MDFRELIYETVRKGYEQRSIGEFGRYAEHEIVQIGTSRQPARLRHEHLRDFSDSFTRHLGE